MGTKIKVNIFTLFLLCLLQSCNPIWKPTDADEEFGANQPGTVQAQNGTWSFNTPGNYTFDPNYISVTAGKATLLTVDQTHDSAADFASGTHVGTAYSSNTLTLASAGGCDATTTNCAELDLSWTPQYTNIVQYHRLNGTGILTNGSTVAADIGVDGTSSDGADNSMVYSNGQVRQSLSFDGIDDSIIIPDPYYSNNFTIAFWVKPETTTTGSNRTNALVKRNWTGGASSNEWQIIVNVATGVFATAWNASNAGIISIAGNIIPNADDWGHVVFTHTGTAAYLYYNGVMVGEDLSTGTVNNSSSPLGIGVLHNHGSRYFDGAIDEIAIWNTSLTSKEIAKIYNRQSAKFSGYFESPIMNLGSSGSWTNIDWVTSLPFGKELPGSSGNELSTDYASLVDSTGVSGDSDLSDGLVGLWHFNETALNQVSGTEDFKDSSGNNLHLSESGSIAVNQDGTFSRSVYFDGVNDTVSRSNVDFGNLAGLTISIWAKNDSATITVNQGLFNKGSSIFEFTARSVNGGVGVWLKNDSAYHLSTGTTGFTDHDKWHHYAASYDGSRTRIYRDGVLVRTSGIESGLISDVSGSLHIGRSSSGSGRWKGQLDEPSIWSRALTDNEILELYRRGANRVKFQVRSCDDSACVGESWIGPDGTASTYFSELHNCTSINGATGECNGNVQTESPSLTFSEYVSAPANNQYFQYRAILESDDENTACAGGTQTCMPSVSSIEIGPTGRYYGGSPTIVNTTPVGFSSLSAFTETAGGACTATYQVSSDGATFYYWTGATWAVAGGVAQSNNAADINTNISSFTGVAGAGSLYWKAFLTSDTSQDCELDELNFSYL